MTTLEVQKSTRTERMIYWISTSIFCILDGLLPALTFNSAMAKQGILHLGFPDYFRIELSIGKIIGAILLITPMVPPRYKEWAYVGFGISLISAFVGNLVVDGIKPALFPIIGMALLSVSYVYYHRVYAPFKAI